VEELEDKVKILSNKILRDIDHPKNWQPSDYLPNFSTNWVENINQIQEQSRSLPNELLVVLVGNMITEEALPTYQSLINKVTATKDLTGSHESAWGKWTRWWTAEENRHGDLMHNYLNLIPKLNMNAVEKDIQYLISRGFNPGIGEDPYKLMVYTSFQEKATHVSHLGTAKIAKSQGDERLYDICTAIAADEARHFSFYKGVMKEIFEKDANGAMTSYAQMMKNTIPMPAKNMSSSSNSELFRDFSEVAQAIDIYNAKDYADIMNQLNNDWEISKRSVNSEEAIKAQEYLMDLPGRYLRLAERRGKGKFYFDSSKFDWLIR
jgi:acyl-[acyl-carrier-protein] desaturase